MYSDEILPEQSNVNEGETNGNIDEINDIINEGNNNVCGCKLDGLFDDDDDNELTNMNTKQ